MTLKAQYSYGWSKGNVRFTSSALNSHNRDMATVVLTELSHITTGNMMKRVVQKRVINDIPAENFRPQNAENCKGCRVKDTPFLRLQHYIE